VPRRLQDLRGFEPPGGDEHGERTVQGLSPSGRLGVRACAPAAHADLPSHDLTFLEGDACRVPSLSDRSFDLVFGNSVIEHVGAEARRAAFAAEVRRLGRTYWVQTPSMWFPIEAHTAMPFWWFHPRPLRESFVRRWHRALPAWADAVAETSVLTREELLALFPEASLYVESVLGIPKSYVAYFRDSPS
jgi:hypothetical protein